MTGDRLPVTMGTQVPYWDPMGPPILHAYDTAVSTPILPSRHLPNYISTSEASKFDSP